MNSEVTERDGLVLSNIRLKGRLMAERISVPYFTIETNQTPSQRGELRPNDSGGSLRSRLVAFSTEINAERLIVKATYVVGNISSSGSCLNITQQYEFLRKGLFGPCAPDPSPFAPQCSRWRAFVSYSFDGRNNETLKSLNVAQRQHFKVNDKPRNSVALFKDCDDSAYNGNPQGCVLNYGGLVFQEKLNPLFSEYYMPVIVDGKSANQWDNMHQTYRQMVSEPSDNIFSNRVMGGCPECVHTHWRWSKSFGKQYGDGLPLLPSGSNQDLSIAVVRYRSGEEHPSRLLDLLSFTNPEPIRFTITDQQFFNRSIEHYNYTAPEEVVYWVSGTGHKSNDILFNHYSFFIDSQINNSNNIGNRTSQIQRSEFDFTRVKFEKSERAAQPAVLDAPSAITYGFLYKSGATTYYERSTNTLPQLPNGFTAYNGTAFDVRTEAYVSGPHQITFNLPSVQDQTIFNKLRVLQLEPNPINPTTSIWVDRTILAPNNPMPDFANRNLSAKVDKVGLFAVGQITSPPAPNNTVTDLAVTINTSAAQVVAGSNLTYTINVANNGSNNIDGVGLTVGLSPDAEFVSADAGLSRFCQETNGTVVCDLSGIAPGATIPVTIIARPNEGTAQFPVDGKTVTISAFVRASGSDSDLSNNSASKNITALPNPNAPPSVQIQTPAADSIFTGPVDFSVFIKANDGDGSISQVELWENGASVGTGVVMESGLYYVTLRNVLAGEHSYVATATDNGGRKAISAGITVFVNGPALVTLDAPENGIVFNQPATVVLTSTASYAAGSIAQVEFFANGESIGVRDAPTTGSQYSFAWANPPSGTYSLRAVATDSNGVKSYSAAAVVFVTDPPTINIVNPLSGTSYAKPANITFTANAKDFDGFVNTVDFYVDNTTNLGRATLTPDNDYAFTWANIPAGTYSITAVATDNWGANTTSAAVNVTITNQLPTVSLTAPANGTTVSAPTSVAISATATDSDGGISKVQFFAGTTLLSEDFSPEYSTLWQNMAPGTYNLTAKAFDSDGAVTTSNPVAVTINPRGNALLVIGNTTLNSVDNALRTRLRNLGFNVTVKSATAAASADAVGKMVIVISDTVTPTNVNTKFRAVTVPVVTLDPELFDEMGMTGSVAGTDFGTATNQNNVTISNASHPLAAGLTNAVQVVNANTTFAWGIINANAAKIATLTTDSNKATDFGYESGAAMPGLAAPARRVGFFYTGSSSSLAASGGALFDAAIKWAIGQ